MTNSRRRRNRTGKIRLKSRLPMVSVSGVVTTKPNRNVTGRAALSARKDAVSANGVRFLPNRTATSALRLKPVQVQASGAITIKSTGTEFSAEFSSEFGKSDSNPGTISGMIALKMAIARESAIGSVTSRQTSRSFTVEFASEFN
jgi:hypothetical protein